jgi:hypothetical protein
MGFQHLYGPHGLLATWATCGTWAEEGLLLLLLLLLLLRQWRLSSACVCRECQGGVVVFWGGDTTVSVYLRKHRMLTHARCVLA